MRRAIFVITLLGLVLQTYTSAPPCVCLLTYSQEAIELVFNAEKDLLQAALSNSEISTTFSGMKLHAEQIHINSADIRKISAYLIPNFGIEVFIIADLFISYKIYNKVNSLHVLANVTSILGIDQDFFGNPKLDVKNCYTTVKNSDVLEETESLEVLEEAIALALNHKICLISSNILLGVNVQLGKFTDLINLGAYLQLKYYLASPSKVNKQQVDLEVNIDYYILGNRVDISAQNECIFLPGQASKSVPMYSLQLHQDTFNAIFNGMEWAGAFNLDISGEMVDGVNTLTTETLKSVSPDISKLYPEANNVILKVGVSKVPRVTLHTGMIILYLQPSLEIMVVPEFSAYDSLMVLSTDIQMKVNIKVEDYNLQTHSVELTRNMTFSIETSAVGSVKLDTLQAIIYPFVEKDILFHYKGALGIGWQLPSLLQLKLTNTNVDVYEGYAVVSGNLQLKD